MGFTFPKCNFRKNHGSDLKHFVRRKKSVNFAPGLGALCPFRNITNIIFQNKSFK